MASGMPEGGKGIMGWVLVIAIISFILLIMAIIFGNLSGNVGFTTDSTAFSNETITFSTAGSTPATGANKTNPSLAGIIITNATGGETVPANNYTVDGATITAVATSAYVDKNVNVSATVTYDEQGKVDTDNIIKNYTKSATNTTSQFPTVGTITGVAVLLLILIGLLIFAIKKMMGVAGATGGSSSFGGSSKFSGSSRKYS